MDDMLIGMIRNLFHVTTMKITFIKANGDLREMNATLNFQTIPKEFWPADNIIESKTTYSRDVLRVFDVDINEWRSFRWDSLKTIKPVSPDGSSVTLELKQ